jgi:hypothetical protein
MTKIVVSDSFRCSNDSVRKSLSGRDLTEFFDDDYIAYLDDETFVVEEGEVVLESSDDKHIEVDLYVRGLTVGVQRGEADDIEIDTGQWVVVGLSEL